MTDDYPTAKDLKDGLRRVFGVDSDMWQYFDSIEERSQGVVPAEAPLKNPPCTCRNFQGDHEEDCYWGGGE